MVPDNLTSFLFFGGFLLLAMTRQERVHALFVPLVLLALMLDTVLVNPTIGG